MNRWTFTLPMYTAIGFLIISSPFLIGILDISLHGGGYSALYVIVNFIPLWIVSGLLDAITESLFKGYNLYLANLVAIGVLLVFWVLVSFLVGIVLDNLTNISRHD